MYSYGSERVVYYLHFTIFGDGLSFNITLLIYYVDFQSRSGAYTVGDFMTKKEHLDVVKPTTTVEDRKSVV